MNFDDLDAVYQRLAAAIDRAGPADEALFLAKLALALAHRLDDRPAVEAAIEAALRDLPTATPSPEGCADTR